MTAPYVAHSVLGKYASAMFGVEESKEPTKSKADVFKNLFKEYMNTVEDASSSSEVVFSRMTHDRAHYKKLSDDDSHSIDDRVAYRAIYTVVSIVTLYYMSKVLKNSKEESLTGVPEHMIGRIAEISKEFGEYVKEMFI